MNTTSFIFGVAFGIVGAFGTGFLKKAGEDLYLLIKNKLYPNPVKNDLPQLVVHVHDSTVKAETSPVIPVNSAPVAVEHISRLSFDDIEKAVESAPPMQKNNIANTFVGIRIEWNSYLRAASKENDGSVFLRLSIDKVYCGRSVLCKVPAEEYPILSVLPEGAPIRISGEISKYRSYDLELTNVRLQI